VTDGIETPHPDREGIRAFQLRILAGMRNSEVMVEQALGELGADQAEMEACRAATENVFAPTGRLENVTSILGPPLARETVHYKRDDAADALTLTKLSYQLPLWPDLVFYFLGHPGWPMMHDFGFARSPQAPQVTFQSPHELQPWGCLLSEVIASFGPPVQEGDLWAPYAEYLFQAPTILGEFRRFWAIFSWNLLQHVEWI
jgi:hypothetical protein